MSDNHGTDENADSIVESAARELPGMLFAQVTAEEARATEFADEASTSSLRAQQPAATPALLVPFPTWHMPAKASSEQHQLPAPPPRCLSFSRHRRCRLLLQQWRRRLRLLPPTPTRCCRCFRHSRCSRFFSSRATAARPPATRRPRHPSPPSRLATARAASLPTRPIASLGRRCLERLSATFARNLHLSILRRTTNPYTSNPALPPDADGDAHMPADT